jgi:Ca2+-binding RTX toxin-like protein
MKERARQLLKRLLLSVTVMTMLATLMIGTAGYAKDFTCPNETDCPGGNVTGTDKTDKSTGDDNITGDDRPNDLRGLGGDDLIKGMGGNDVIDGGAGNDELRGNGGGDTLFGREGNDKLIGGGGNDTLWGGPGDDTLLDNQEQPNADSTSDEDKLYGGAGNDYLNASDRDPRDYLDGGADTDICDGDPGDNFQESCETINRITPAG